MPAAKCEHRWRKPSFVGEKPSFVGDSCSMVGTPKLHDASILSKYSYGSYKSICHDLVHNYDQQLHGTWLWRNCLMNEKMAESVICAGCGGLQSKGDEVKLQHVSGT